MNQAATVPSAARERIGGSVQSWTQRHGNLILMAMLLLLHVAVVRGVADVWARGLLVAHLGLLLLWQPFVRGQQTVSFAQAALIVLAAVGVMTHLNWWLLVLWVIVLTGTVGGKVYQQEARWVRFAYLLVFVYLAALLAVVILPEIAPRREVTNEVRTIAVYVLPVLLIALPFAPVDERSGGDTAQAIDFFYSVFLMLLLGVIVLGSFTLMTSAGIAYLEALTYTVLALAASVLIIGVVWSPRTGYAGLSVFFSRYLFSIGLPIERWLEFLAELSQTESQPERFLQEGVSGLLRLPWVAGARWRSGGGSGLAGQPTEFNVDFEGDQLSLSIYSRYRLSPALYWHLTLLARLLAEFHVGKLREGELERSAYMKAVHETGARMTHDVKNLLQSLQVLCSMATRPTGGSQADVDALIRRQLPMIAQRLTETLGQLQRPVRETEDRVAFAQWWESLQHQYRDAGVEFIAQGELTGHGVPQSLFDSVADNLLQNALAKRARSAAELRIRVQVSGDENPTFSVCDSGAPIPAELAASLFNAPVRSSAGMGIGLYQAARYARERGYVLVLASNRDGDVCFALMGAATAAERKDPQLF